MKTMFTLPAALSFLFFLGLSVPVFAHDGAHDSKAHDTYDKMKHSEGSATKEMDSHTGGHLGQGHEYSEGSDSMNREMGHKSHMGQSGEYKHAHDNYEKGKAHHDDYEKKKSHHMREGS